MAQISDQNLGCNKYYKEIFKIGYFILSSTGIGNMPYWKSPTMM